MSTKNSLPEVYIDDRPAFLEGLNLIRVSAQDAIVTPMLISGKGEIVDQMSFTGKSPIFAPSSPSLGNTVHGSPVVIDIDGILGDLV